MISRESLERYYLSEKKSSKEIANILGCSENKINYWLQKHGIQKRSISDSVYAKRNPSGDPFAADIPLEINESFIYGLGIGLFWGEGNKRNKNSIRLGNTDPDLIKAFIVFLKIAYRINLEKLNFSIQIFNDLDTEAVREFWVKKLGIRPEQIYKKVTISKSGKKGTYKKKNKYGVITVYFNNTKLKKIIDAQIENLREIY